MDMTEALERIMAVTRQQWDVQMELKDGKH